MKSKEVKTLIPMNIQLFADGGDGEENKVIEEGNKGSENKGSENKEKNDENDNKAVINEFIKSLGIDSEESLKGIIKKQKEAEDANKTELDRVNDTLKSTTSDLIEERKKRLEAETKLHALLMDADPKKVDDLVIVAMSKVTKDKDVKTVISEMKESETSSHYFLSKEDKENRNKEGNFTRKRQKKDNSEKKEEDGSLEGTFAKRILDGRGKQKKSTFFTR